ncbi:kinase activator [Xylariaceae sp. FL0804]|nr:kinase activator [Xylariaceae sp. FL0804]
MPPSPSPASSQSASRLAEPRARDTAADSVPVETLVQYLLDAKRSLSSMRLVLRANELVHLARQAHQESVILSAQSEFLRRGISDQVRLLIRVRKSLGRTYDTGKRDFKQIIKTLDTTNGRLEETMDVLRGRVVERAFRPDGEPERSLLDFVDELQVETMRNALKENIQALQATQQSFDGDLLRFDSDLRNLSKTMSSAPSPSSPSASSAEPPVSHLLSEMMGSSHAMAELLTSLTKHFDLCVTAVRTTEGGAALARIKAAEASNTQGGEDVSISGVMSEQESHTPDLEPISSEDRAQMLEVVVQDASEVEDVVRELNERLQSMDADFARLDEQTGRVRLAYEATLAAFRALEDLGAARLPGYVAAEAEFRERWEAEADAIRDKMDGMEGLRGFYESYAGSYDGLLLEAGRRRALEDKVRGIWRRAKESVDRVVEGDRRERELFRHEVAEFLPTDLWPGMDDPMPEWEVRPVVRGAPRGTREVEVGGRGAGSSTPALERSVVQAASSRLGRTTK